jgi:hypothetical protein
MDHPHPHLVMGLLGVSQSVLKKPGKRNSQKMEELVQVILVKKEPTGLQIQTSSSHQNKVGDVSLFARLVKLFIPGGLLGISVIEYKRMWSVKQCLWNVNCEIASLVNRCHWRRVKVSKSDRILATQWKFVAIMWRETGESFVVERVKKSESRRMVKVPPTKAKTTYKVDHFHFRQ